MRVARQFVLDLCFLIVFGLLYWKPFIFNVNNSFNSAIPLNPAGFGIDISHHNGSIDWKSLLNDDTIYPEIDFVFLKATEGSDLIDERFHENSTQLNAFDISVGYYHFFRMTSPSLKQAQFFLETTNYTNQGLPAVLDVETDLEKRDDVIDSMRVWLNYVEESTGQRPIIYCPWRYFHHKLEKAFPQHKFWVARYGSKVPLYENNAIIYWQFTDEGALPFHEGKVDLNVSSISY